MRKSKMDIEEAFDNADKYKAEIVKQITQENPLVRVTVHPAICGGPISGWRPTGNFRVGFVPNIFGITDNPPEKVIYTSKMSFKEVEKSYKEVKEAFEDYSATCQIFWIYLHSGLIPRHVGENHKKKMENKFGNLNLQSSHTSDPKQRKYLHELMSGYLRKWAKCPQCGKTGFLDTILGWTCPGCRTYLDDTGTIIEWKDNHPDPYNEIAP